MSHLIIELFGGEQIKASLIWFSVGGQYLCFTPLTREFSRAPDNRVRIAEVHHVLAV